MNKNELEKRTQTITTLLSIYDKGADKNMITAYVTVTKDIPLDVLEKTCKKLMVESESRPVPATIVKAAKELVAEANGTDVLPFAEAWKEITKELHDTFVYGTPKFSRPEIKQAVDAFGWQELCEMRTQDIPIIRAQLKAMYEGICKKNQERAVNGYVLGTTVLIGDENAVRLMLE